MCIISTRISVHRQHRAVQDEEARQRAVVVGLAAEQHLLHERADDRHRVADVGADGGAPVAELLEHQAVAGEAEHQRAHQQRHADHPVELARPAVGAGEEHAHLVQDDGGDHQRRAPLVQAAQVPAERRVFGDVAHRLVGRRRRRLVVERQQDAGDDLDDEEIGRRAAEREPPPLQVMRHRLVGHRGDALDRHRHALADPAADVVHARAPREPGLGLAVGGSGLMLVRAARACR